MTDYADLRRLAEAATPGPWFDDYGKIGAGDSGIGEMDRSDDAAYIAAASPDVVLALLDRLDGLRAALDRLLAVAMVEEEDVSPATQDEWIAAITQATHVLNEIPVAAGAAALPPEAAR